MPLEKSGTPEELVHFGIKGMRWGVRNERGSSESSGSVKKRMSTKKKVAIGVGIGAAVAGAAATGYILGSRGKLRISDIDGGPENLIRLKKGQMAISTLTNKQWDMKISNARTSARQMDVAAKSIAARRKANFPGYRPGEILGKSATLFNDLEAYSRRRS